MNFLNYLKNFFTSVISVFKQMVQSIISIFTGAQQDPTPIKPTPDPTPQKPTDPVPPSQRPTIPEPVIQNPELNCIWTVT